MKEGGLNKRDLEHFRKLLLKERERVLEELGWVEDNYIRKSRRESTGDVSGYSMHPADMGTDSMEMEKAYLIGAASGKVLEDIDEALRNVDGESYGLCVTCGEEISKDSLEAVPHARLCVKCQSEAEGSSGATR
jgi:DnaK suppressor protein